MVGLVVATHGRLADELVATAEQIVGKLPNVATCSIEPGSSNEELRGKVRSAIASVDEGDGVIVFADLFGGTPCKECLMISQRGHIEVLAGVNLPMLLKANSLRLDAMPLPEMAQALALYGQRNINVASALVRGEAAAPRS